MKKQFLMFSLLASSFAVFASDTDDDTPVAVAQAEGNCCKRQLKKFKKFAGPQLNKCGNKCCPRGTARRKGWDRCGFKLSTAWTAFKNPYGTPESISKAEERARIANLISPTADGEDDHEGVTSEVFAGLLEAYQTAQRVAERTSLANSHFPRGEDADDYMNVTRDGFAGLLIAHQEAATELATQAERDAAANILFRMDAGYVYENVTEAQLTGLLEADRTVQRDEATVVATQAARDAIANRFFRMDDNSYVYENVTEVQLTDFVAVAEAAQRDDAKAVERTHLANLVSSTADGEEDHEDVTEGRFVELLNADRTAQRDGATVVERTRLANLVSTADGVVEENVTENRFVELLNADRTARAVVQPQSSVETILSRATILSGLLIAAGILRK